MHALSRTTLAALIGAALWTVGCGTQTKPIAGSANGASASGSTASSGAGTDSSGGSSGSSGSTASGSDSGSTGDSGSSGATAGSSSTGDSGTTSGTTGEIGSTGSTGASSSSTGSSGSTGLAVPGYQGTITYDTLPVTHPAWVAALVGPPSTHPPAVALVTTDDDGSYALPLDAGGRYWVAAVYEVGDAGPSPDGGPAFPLFTDGGLRPGFVASFTPEAFGATLGGPTSVDIDVTEMTVFAISLTVNTSALLPADAGVPAGAITMPDGGKLYPLLLDATISGKTIANQSIEDFTLATVTPPGASALGMAHDATNHDFDYVGDVNTLSTWKPATDGTYAFSASGSHLLGGLTDGGSVTLPRAIDLHPQTDVPHVTSPVNGSTHSSATEATLTVSWEAQSDTSYEIVVYEFQPSGGSGNTSKVKVCDAQGATNPVIVGFNQSVCNSGFFFHNNRDYEIDVTSTQQTLQAEGAAFSSAITVVSVSY